MWYVLAGLMPATRIETGPNKSLGGRLLFPADDPWNADVSKEPDAEARFKRETPEE